MTRAVQMPTAKNAVHRMPTCRVVAISHVLAVRRNVRCCAQRPSESTHLIQQTAVQYKHAAWL